MTGPDQGEGATTATSSLHSPTRFARLRRWVLLDGNRNVLAAGIVLGTLLIFVAVGYSGILNTEQTTIQVLYLFSALAGGNITLLTLVITISQLILSRELRSPRELQLELESAEEYRDSVEEETNNPVIPEHPEEFLRELVEETRHHVRELDSTIDEVSDPTLEAELTELTSKLQVKLDGIQDQLETSRSGLFGTLSIILDVDFSAYLNHSRWIRQADEDTLSTGQQKGLENLEQRIEQLDVARQYFKTIHLMQALADISKLIMYTGLLATIISLLLIVFAGSAPTPLSPLTRLVVIPFAVGVGLTPLSLLITHVLRITTIARRTAAITPFISPSE